MTSMSPDDAPPEEAEDRHPRRSVRGHPPRWQRLLLILGLLHVAIVAFSLFSPLLTGEPRGQTPFSVHFDVNYQGNFPTWVAVVQLAAATTVLTFTAFLSHIQKSGGTLAWWILAVMVLLLCLDEGTWLHERLDVIAPQFVTVEDLTFVWLIFGIPVAVVTLIVAILSARNLPEDCTKLVILGVVTLLFAAIGLEFLAGELIKMDAATAVVAALYHLEELMELVAGALLLVAPMAGLRLRTEHGVTTFAMLGRSRR
ncbi:hypothetical protein [Arthrobacter sp. H5]|uniref:hypothetical protein n=1 Tax=Arthrobacter sp. H5 TaxID=1267973 RepID=UPI0012DE94F1|nr:hypothetical protein [Arthrobacter sp. H5]